MVDGKMALMNVNFNETRCENLTNGWRQNERCKLLIVRKMQVLYIENR